MKTYSSDVDHRFVDCIVETTTQTLTANTNNKNITQNFDGELSPVQFVVVRDMSDIDANSDAFVQVANIHREDQSGQNLENGIVWSDNELRNYVYPQFFQHNKMSQVSSGNKYIYPLVSSLDPLNAVKKGINSGYTVLPKNHKLVLNPTGTLSSHQIDYCCYVYRHVRISSGLIRVY